MNENGVIELSQSLGKNGVWWCEVGSGISMQLDLNLSIYPWITRL